MVHLKAKDYEAMSRMASNLIYSQVLAKPNSVLGFATGSTPLGTYKYLIEQVNQNGMDFSQVTSFNLDEYCTLPADNPQSYTYYMQENLFDKLSPGTIHLPDGMASDIDGECQRYETLIQDCGGIDLQLLGIGHNGHIGFNEPAECYSKVTHKTPLTKSTIEANSRFFNSQEEVPQLAITMGIGTIMRAKRVILIVSGEEKADILRQTIEGPITPQVPASILQLHPDVIVISCD